MCFLHDSSSEQWNNEQTNNQFMFPSIPITDTHDLQWNQSIDNGRSPTYRYDENNLSLDVRQLILVQLQFLEEEKLGSNGQVLVHNDLFTIQIQREGPFITPIVLRSILLIP